MSITAEQRDAWVAALRSGRYQKGVGFLHFRAVPNGVDQYCCLGVLAHAVLGTATEELTGKEDLDLEVLPFETQDFLQRLNDSGMSFARIADLLENAGDPESWG